MIYSSEVKNMCVVAKGPNHGPAPIPEEGKWVYAKEIADISGYTHGVGWCAPQQGACKLSLNVKDGVIEDAGVIGTGCAISQASASLMIDLVKGRTVEDAHRLISLYFQMIKGKITPEELDDLEDVAALQGIAHVPARVKCAVLAWHTLEEALDGEGKTDKVTTEDKE